jgi:putative ABC transport system permease protein
VNLWETIRIALRALRSNKMRTALTMLGMMIGVGAVIAMVAIGEGAARSIRKQFESMGTNLLSVRGGSPLHKPGSPHVPGQRWETLIPEDAQAIGRKFPDTIAMVAAVSRGSGTIKMGARSGLTNVIGGTPEYTTVAKWTVAEGRGFTQTDEQGRARVALLGRTAIETLTGDRNNSPIGEEFLINRERFQVVGILGEKGMGGFGQDQDDVIMVPCSTAMRRILNKTYLSEINVTCNTAEDMDLATEQIVSLLRQRHHLRPPFPENDDFNVRSQAQLLEASQESSSVMTSLLGGIALVSLLVGGIGIMNIMLVSVTERTREIGIRKAVGATSHHILVQFLIEAVVIAIIGGLVGIGLGAAAAHVMARLLQWSVFINPVAVVASVVVSGSAGIFFGIYPARKAARLHPIEALRYE